MSNTATLQRPEHIPDEERWTWDDPDNLAQARCGEFLPTPPCPALDLASLDGYDETIK